MADYLEALNPQRSAVVEACAGSGKTWMLVSRILRLLLDGVPPAEILAITFTRLAAREMEERLLEWLTFLALQSDEAVLAFLSERGLKIESSAANAHAASGQVSNLNEETTALLVRARGLLEQYLLASPSVTLSTLDAWYLNLLRHAPLSSNFMRDCTPNPDTRSLRLEAWQSLLARHSDEHTETGAALDWLFRNQGLDATRQWVMAFVDWRAEWWAYTAGETEPVVAALARLKTELNVDSCEDIAQSLAQHNPFAAVLERLALQLEQGSATLKNLAAELRAGFAQPDRLQRIRSVLRTADGEGGPRKNIAQAAEKAGAAVQADYDFLLQVIDEAWLRFAAQQVLQLNSYALYAGVAYLNEVMALKEARREADFADIQWSVYTLLNHSEDALHLQYRLDSRYRHVLLDEFQDTSPLQWLILKTWLEASRGAERSPTVFMVGDPKQSIYRFRRADPRLFDQATEYLQHHWQAVRVTLNMSRRSGKAIIGLVNRVFTNLAHFNHFKTHTVTDHAPQDAVRIIESGEPEQGAVKVTASTLLRNPLYEPRSTVEETQAQAEGRSFARQVQEWVGVLEIDDPKVGMRRATYGDFLVLVRRRSLLEPYESALRAACIPYLTRQRGGLLGTLEIQDVRQLLCALVNPADHLALAQTLRSPIFDASDEDLLILSATRDWWAALQQQSSPVLQAAAAQLTQWVAWSVSLPVHDLLDRIMGEGALVQRYQERLPEALQSSVRANLEAFLELALTLNSGRYPSLPRFLQELDDIEQVEDEAPDEGGLGNAGNAVRIMTIHGAKGLESPIVWLLEPAQPKAHAEGRQWFVDWPPGDERPQHFSLMPSKSLLAHAQKKRLQEEESHRQREEHNLLYVALTRAKNGLVVSGRAGEAGSNWFKMVRAQALDNELISRTFK
jgi:ATP-dependent helicase/nuclease subunit A